MLLSYQPVLLSFQLVTRNLQLVTCVLPYHKKYAYALPKFRSIEKFKWIVPKECDSSKYSSNSLKGCGLEVDFQYPERSHELFDDYTLVPDKIEI